MQTIKRFLNLKLPSGQSAFLWGPRKTGKTTYLKEHFPQSILYDFLKADLFLDFSKKPWKLREELIVQDPARLAFPIILDEVQKIPQILDEVHWLIENKKISFILCGSSARKLVRGHANLLGGRAWRYEMCPLTTVEIKHFDLLRALNQGLIPTHYMQAPEYCQKSLQAYVQDYLKEEVFYEGLIRNIPAFSRFFDAMGYSHGELTNYLDIARDCAIDSKTVKEYYQILVDTLLGSSVEPFKKRQHRQVISKASKFYLFDVGVAGFLTKRSIAEERGELFGKALEHFIFMEIKAYKTYYNLDIPINFWRTTTGLEVDFILAGGEIAIEVKGVHHVDSHDIVGLSTFREIYNPRKTILVCNESSVRKHKDILIMPWRIFLEELWNRKIC